MPERLQWAEPHTLSGMAKEDGGAGRGGGGGGSGGCSLSPGDLENLPDKLFLYHFPFCKQLECWSKLPFQQHEGEASTRKNIQGALMVQRSTEVLPSTSISFLPLLLLAVRPQ